MVVVEPENRDARSTVLDEVALEDDVLDLTPAAAPILIADREQHREP